MNPLLASTEILNTFDPISLTETDAVQLLDRIDKKYIFHASRLSAILEKLMDSYFVLTISEKRSSRYHTRYFDTENREIYLSHHSGKLNRVKIRLRYYTDSGISFFEIKTKTNKGRTIKHRVSITDPNNPFTESSEALLNRKTIYNRLQLLEMIQVNYSRITLVNKDFSERVTLDTGLGYVFNEQNCSFPELVIAEVKQDRNSFSPFISLMQANHLHPKSLSKYCLGIACMDQTIKYNRFKSHLLYVKKLCKQPE